MSEIPDPMEEVGKAEIRHRNKGEATKITYMVLGWLTVALSPLLIQGVLTLNTNAHANERVSEVLASFREFSVTVTPTWEVVGGNLQATIVTPALLRYLEGNGWAPTAVRLRVKDSVYDDEQKQTMYHYEGFTDMDLFPDPLPDTMTFSFAPESVPDGAFVSGHSYYPTILVVLGEPGGVTKDMKISLGWWKAP